MPWTCRSGFAVVLLAALGACGGSSMDPDTPENRAPSVDVTAPVDGHEEAEGRRVTVSGEAADPEDGDLSAEITWSSDLDGILGRGTPLEVELSPGEHTITASVEDAGGRTGEASTGIVIRELRWTAVTAGASHTCALVTLGYAYCWGQNLYDGQLGTPDVADVADRPTPVAGDYRFESLSAGPAHNCGILAEGGVLCWGALSSEEGVLGHGEATGSATPVMVMRSLDFQQVVTADWHNCALDDQGQAWCWGWNASRTLGQEEEPERALSPVRVDTGVRFQRLAARSSHVCGLTAERAAYCWGSAGAGEIGDGDVRDWAITPSRVLGSHVWSDIAAAGAYTAAVDDDGRLHFWGSRVALKGLSYQSPSDLQPEPDTIPTSDTFQRLLDFRCALRVDGRTLCWGGHDPAIERTDHPVPELADFGMTFTASTLGHGHGCALTADHRLMCWGDGRLGQLGDGTRSIADTPVEVALPAP